MNMLSVVSYPERGNGGNNQYRGNCSPKMIEDIIMQYKVSNLNDYMCGSGTTEDVCRLLWYTKVVTFRSDKIE